MNSKSTNMSVTKQKTLYGTMRRETDYTVLVGCQAIEDISLGQLKNLSSMLHRFLKMERRKQ
jgi:hypothetical protein